MKRTTRWITTLAAVCLSFAGFMQSARATLVTTEQVAAAEGVRSATAQRDFVNATLARADVASGLAGALRALVQSGTVPLADCRATGLELLDHGPLRDSGILTVHSGQLAFVRRSCCLYYRIEGGGLCGDCALARRPAGWPDRRPAPARTPP